MTAIDTAALTTDDTALFARIALALRSQGYAVLPNALPAELAEHLQGLLAAQTEFHSARIGRGSAQLANPFVRRDRISWIDASSAGGRAWLAWTAQLQRYLNRHLLLGLFSFESHFAHYRPGDFYKKHVDAFRSRHGGSQSTRVLSLVTYLNSAWLPDQGGELVLYDANDGELLKVTPNMGTLVLFLSEEFPHEVLPAQRERYSVAGWFRVNGSINNAIDPPIN